MNAGKAAPCVLIFSGVRPSRAQQHPINRRLQDLPAAPGLWVPLRPGTAHPAKANPRQTTNRYGMNFQDRLPSPGLHQFSPVYFNWGLH